MTSRTGRSDKKRELRFRMEASGRSADKPKRALPDLEGHARELTQ